MSEYTRMPPSLNEKWTFPVWNMVAGGPECAPWEHKHFWYYDHSGSGDWLLIDWTISLIDDYYEVYSGEIHRYKDLLDATKHWEGLINLVGADLSCRYLGGIYIVDGPTRIAFPCNVAGDKMPISELYELWKVE